MMLLAQRFANLPARGSKIPGTNQPFLYWQDFYCQKWGNTFAMPLMLTAFISAYSQNLTSLLWWVLSINIGFWATVIFTVLCLATKHKPDWGFPVAGEISLGGIIHLFYFWIYATVIVFTFGHLSSLGKLDSLALLSGLIIYAINFVKDVKSGNFQPLIKQ